VLIALRSDIQPETYSLETNVCVIGRGETCQVIVPGKVISRIHATIERNGPHCYLHDANSANGTYVNDRRIREKCLLKDQDKIGLGPGTPLLRFDDPEATTQVLLQLRYDTQLMQFSLNNEPLELTPLEFRLLYYLYQHAGDVCLRETCAEAVWQRAYDPGPDDEGLDKLVVKLRKKLADISPEAREMIVTRRGLGYLLDL
jgi:DNA-binding response OmpR family regulator